MSLSLTWQPPLHTGESPGGTERWDIWPLVEWQRSNMCNTSDKSEQPTRWHIRRTFTWLCLSKLCYDLIVFFISGIRHRQPDHPQDVAAVHLPTWFASLNLTNAKPVRESWPLCCEKQQVETGSYTLFCWFTFVQNTVDSCKICPKKLDFSIIMFVSKVFINLFTDNLKIWILTSSGTMEQSFYEWIPILFAPCNSRFCRQFHPIPLNSCWR